eukprot:scaffold1.g5689.t1
MPYPAPPATEVPHSLLPHPMPLAGVLAPNAQLAAAGRVCIGVDKPETPVVLPDGTVYCGGADGVVYRSSVKDPGQLEPVVPTGGQLVGMAWHPDGFLAVCDATRGLLAVDPTHRTVTLLSTRVSDHNLPAADAAIMFCDGLDVGRDGRIFFTADESAVVVAETFSMRLLRHWLAGPKAGQTEVFADGLPGEAPHVCARYPDGVSLAPGGKSFLVALANVPNKVARALAPSRVLRWLVAWLPDALVPMPEHYGLVLQVGHTLFCGSLGHPYVCTLDLEAAAAN